MRYSPGPWWSRRGRCSRWNSSIPRRVPTSQLRVFCGAMGGGASTSRPGRGWRCAAESNRCCWRGCAAEWTAVTWPLRSRSPTGWWPSSASRWPAGAGGRTGAQDETGKGSPPPMLEEVRITGLGVIEDAVLEFSSGFTVVTGETGAGKTMVVTGLGLMFGGRADPARVRPGADRATVEGRLQIEADGPVAQQVRDAGGELDDDGRTLIVSRSVSAEGRSRAYSGGRGVPVSLLIGLADDLVAVHGQADQQQLLRAARQRQALDEFAGPALSAVMADYRRAYARHREVQAELTELTTRARERAAEAEDLRRALDEIERVEPVAGEDTMLLAEEERLGHADALHAAATTAHGALLGDPSDGSYQGADAVTLLGTARQALDAVAAHDPDLASLAARLSEAAYLISDVATDLASYVESLDSDPARLAAVQERRAELTRLIRAYGGRVPVPVPAPAEAGEPGSGRPEDPADGTAQAPDIAPGTDAA